VVQLDADRAAFIADREVGVEPAVLDPQVVQVAQRLPGEEAKLGWCRLASSSVMTTTGSTTRCSANLPMAAGSASRTLVSRT
jgi:hypothetical protein